MRGLSFDSHLAEAVEKVTTFCSCGGIYFLTHCSQDCVSGLRPLLLSQNLLEEGSPKPS